MTDFVDLPKTGFLRLSSILAPNGPIPVSKSTWWAGIKDGRFPTPTKLGPRVTVWRVEDIRQLLAATKDRPDAPPNDDGVGHDR